MEILILKIKTHNDFLTQPMKIEDESFFIIKSRGLLGFLVKSLRSHNKKGMNFEDRVHTFDFLHSIGSLNKKPHSIRLIFFSSWLTTNILLNTIPLTKQVQQ